MIPWGEVGQFITDHGVAVFVAVSVLTLLGWLVRRLVAALTDTLRASREALKAKDTTINNHLDHVFQALNATGTKVEVLHEKLDGGFTRLVEAINGQTALMKEVLSRDCPLHGSCTPKKED